MLSFETVSQSRCFGGTQFVYRHASRETGTPMRVAVFVPPQAKDAKVPVVWFLSGLTCTEENFTVKAGAQRVASELGLILIAPDTSPRGEGVPDDPEGAYDFGLGAGFYVDATQEPWAKNYRMRSYIEHELPELIAENLPADMSRQGITGHSMGGHGALTIALRNPGRFKAVSAFAPIASPMNCPWGEKALSNYIGPDRSAWREYDACALIENGARAARPAGRSGHRRQLPRDPAQAAIAGGGLRPGRDPLTLRMQDGYDHSYFFIATFIEDHLRWHAERLSR